MEKPKGYFYDNSSLISKVKGFKELSPFARHAVRDLLDLIWESESFSVEDDKKLMKYLGFSDTQWKKIKIELTSLNHKFLYKKENRFYSPWLEIQNSKSSSITKNFEEYQKSYDELDDIDDISNTVEESDNFGIKIPEEETEQNRNDLLFKGKNNSLGASTRANIVSNKLLKKYNR